MYKVETEARVLKQKDIHRICFRSSTALGSEMSLRVAGGLDLDKDGRFKVYQYPTHES